MPSVSPALGRRISLTFESGLIMFMCCAGIAVAKLWKSGADETPLVYLAVLSVPAFATSIYSILGILVPGLLAVGRLAFPLPLTLPLVYTSLVLLAVMMASRVGSSLTAIPEPLNRISVWTDPRVLSLAFLAQVIALTVVGVLGARTKEEA